MPDAPNFGMLQLSHDDRVDWLMKNTARLKEMAELCGVPEDSEWFRSIQRQLDLVALGFYDA